MEFENQSKFQKADSNDSTVFDMPLNYDDAHSQPVGTLVGDAEIMQDLDKVIQSEEDENQSSCGCSSPCACSGSPCSCGSTSSVFSSELLDDIGNSFLELADAFETEFSSSGSSPEQLPMQEFLEITEQAFSRLFDSLIDTTED